MSNRALMHARDAVSGSAAKCYITLNGRRKNVLHLTDFESKTSISKQQVPILGKVGFGNKAAGMAGTWSATAHFNQSDFREVALHYQRTGEMPYFEIVVTNEDKTSSVGRQTIVHYDCLITDDVTLAKFEAGDALLTEEISGTFETFDMPEKFNELEGT
jgi:hypothetical protein